MRKASIIKRIGSVKKTIGVAIVLLSGIMVLCAPAARADTVVQNITWADAFTSWSSSQSINQFNASLGTLTSVTLQFNTSSWGTMQVNNGSAFTRNFTSNLAAETALTSGVTTYFDLVTTSSFPHTLVAGGSVTDTVIKANAATASDIITYNSGLGSWIGGGTISFDASSSNNSTVTGQTGGLTITPTIQSNAGLIVTYTYTPGLSVPEPSSGIVFLLGLMGIAGLNRRFSSRIDDPVASIHWSDWGIMDKKEI